LSKLFDAVINRFSRWVGEWGNALFYNLLYREIFKETYALCDRQVGPATAKFRDIMSGGAAESAERHTQLFWLFPDTPEGAMRYLDILWRIFLGVDLGPFEKVQDTDPDTGRERYVFHIERCPFCGGYGDDAEDAVQFLSKPPRFEGLACGMAGMIERVANSYILNGTGVKVSLAETACMLRGASYLEITVVVVPDAEWAEVGESAKEGERRSKLPFDIAAIEEIVDQPLSKLKEQLAAVIEREAHMTPAEVFGMFENYEEDLVRILGFLPVHFLNEYGNVVQKILQNETFAKLVGYVYNAVKQNAPRFLPPEVARDNLTLFLSFIEDSAPAEMIERYRRFEAFDFLNLLLEGVGLALRDLGVDFNGLKSNLWEELKAQQFQSQERGEGEEMDSVGWLRSPEIIDLVGEFLQLILEVLALPSKLLVAATHAQVKTVVAVRVELLDAVRDRLEHIFDIVQQLREEGNP